ncbi:MAG TPA: MATE family efflux transporter [Bacillota bacterium]
MLKITQLFPDVCGNRNFYRRMLQLALPVMVQNFISSFLNMIDTVMVGKLGETEIAAVGIANQFFFLFNMLMIGLGAGCGVLIAQFWGKGEVKNIKRVLGIGLGSATVIALSFMITGYLFPRGIIAVFNRETRVVALGAEYLKIVLASYVFTGITFIYNFALRSIGKTVQPMLISALAVLCNAFFNYLFIFGKFGAPAMGVAGAALATVIARIVETLLLVTAVYAEKGALAASVSELVNFNMGYLKKSYRVIFPVILNDLCWGLANLVYGAVYGRMGTQAVAVVQICNTISNLFMVVIFGMSSAAAVMVGNSIGAGEVSLGRNYAKRFSVLAVVTGIGLGLVLAGVAPVLLAVFNVSRAARSYALIILYIIALIFFIRVFDIILIVGILRGGGDVRYALLLEGCTMWFVGVPLTILGAWVFQLPVYAVYALAVAEEITKCIFGIQRLKSGRWIHNVIHNLM